MDTLNLEILLGIVAFFINTFLGIIIFLRNRTSWTNRFFFLLVLLIDAYIVTNFISLHPNVVRSSNQLFWIRIVMFVCSFIGPTLLFFVHTFPGKVFQMKKRYSLPILCLMLTSAALSLSPYVFSSLEYVSGQPIPTAGQGIPIFGIDFVGLFLASFVVLGFKLWRASGINRVQLTTVAVGVALSFSLMGISTVISVAILHSSSFVFLGPIYTVLLMAAIAYAIMKYRLFNIKILATELFVLIIGLLYAAKVFASPTKTERAMDIFILFLTAIFGALLIRSVKKEVRIREEINLLADRLADANQELGYKNTQLRIMDQQKSEFVSIASHQLRTPLTAIKGYTSMLLEDSFGKLTDEQRTPVQKIFLSSERMVEMVADFLNVSKIEQGEMVYAFSVVDIGILLTEMTEEFTHTATKKGLTLKLLKEPKKGEFIVFADEGKVRQIFSNLLDNAIKYTEKGWITLDIKENKATKMITVSIADSGVGLSPDDILHLFGKFARGSQGQRQNTGGSGLGLYVVRKMLEAQHGTIRVDSPGLEKGSTFTIELPEGMQSAYATKK